MIDKVEQLEFQNEDQPAQASPVTCLGMTFENDAARRAYFTEELRKKLPELRNIEGFPIGEDEDILALSDPPYYTACPNPWVSEIIDEWESQKPISADTHHHHREPFATDVSEGKNDPIYNAHSYHTKVPFKAIMRYILHYTDPGDIVFDGFCGTGMTGVAAQMCGDRKTINELGFQVDKNGMISKLEINENGKSVWVPFSKLGARRTVLNDLSPAATFISYNYNTLVQENNAERKAMQVLSEVEKEFGWMYETKLTDGRTGKINYTVWSDVFICPECTNEIVYWDAAVNKEAGIVNENFSCLLCSCNLTKRSMERAWVTKYDHAIGQSIQQAKQIPVLINYSIDGKRGEKSPDENDLLLIEKINNTQVPYWFPHDRLMDGKETRRNDPMGITHMHHFYTHRNLIILSAFWELLDNRSKWLITSFVSRNATKMNRFVINHHNPKGRINGPLTGTLYIPSLTVEQSVLHLFADKIFNQSWNVQQNVIQTSSSTKLKIPSESVDYIFIDPPFGANITYSELNFIWESWLKIYTNNKSEAIQDTFQGKDLESYKALMLDAFKEVYRILKPGKWLTVEFSNTQASVWNAIQSSLQEAGFIVANVSILDKKHGGIKAMTNTTNVKQDLVISSYKSNNNISKVESDVYDSESFIWEFLDEHLRFLPVFLKAGNQAVFITERDPRILFDKVVSYLFRRGISIPWSSSEFQLKVNQRYTLREGMVFHHEQVTKYDKQRLNAKEFTQLSLFVSDENSAIEWLRQQLIMKPQMRQDLHPNFMKEIQHIAKHEKLPELDVLLEQNFLKYDGDGEVPSQIHAYLSTDYKDLRNLVKNDQKLIEKAQDRWYVPDPNKQADLEKLREKSLLREFSQYVEDLSDNKKKLKQFRTEAIRVGFYKAWSEKDYNTIVSIGNRLPEAILQEDDKLLRYFDNAQTKLGL